MTDALLPCDCCDYFTIPSGSEYEICRVCFWEQDSFGIDRPDQRSGANHGLTLRQGRWNFEKYQACAERFAKNVATEKTRQQFNRAARQLEDGKVCIVDCINVLDEEGFWAAYVSIVNPGGPEFVGRNLDAFWDGLNGGPGYPGEKVVYFVNVSNLKTFRGGSFYAALKEIAEESGFPVYIE